MWRRRRLCDEHDFIETDQVAPGIVRRVCRKCPTVSIIPTDARALWCRPPRHVTPSRAVTEAMSTA